MTGDQPLPGADRFAAIGELYRRHDAQLHNVVDKHGSRNPAIVDDACAHAWLKLLTASAVDLRPQGWRALAWLTTCAIRRAWQLEQTARRAAATDPSALEHAATAAAGDLTGAVPDIVAQRERLDLVSRLPERPRRFLIRLALGYSYREIAAAEGVSYTTTNKQIAKAKRLLRELDNAQRAGGETHPHEA